MVARRLGAAAALLLLVRVASGYHIPLHQLRMEPHCWPLDADENNDETIDCGALKMEWEVRADTLQVTEGDTISVAVHITADVTSLNGSLIGLCSEECPTNCSDANADNCCVWHAVFHACYPDTPEQEPPPCTPWNDHNVVESERQCGPFGTFNGSVDIYNPGPVGLMFHLKVGNMSIVLGDYKIVNPAVCGDGDCQRRVEVCYCPEEEEEDNEGGRMEPPCHECRKDCCPLELTVIFFTVFTFFVLLVIGIPVGIIVTIFLCIMYRKKKRMKDESWIISYYDITLSAGRKAMSSLVSLNKRKDTTSATSSLDLLTQQIFTEMGTYNGKTVAIRRVRRKRSLFGGSCTISSNLRREVFEIRYLEHQNLCKFIGATVKDPPPNIAIISEYCSKGSLNDVLLNDNVPLNWNFKFSFAGDIAHGMAYLHSHNITHGRLTSSNCVIDDRWVTKITDYGLPGLRHSGETEEEDSEEQLQRCIPKVYRAPEVRDLPPRRPSTSIPADVYSYAIILFEIATRMDPHSEDMWQLDANQKPRINQKQLNETDCPCSQDYLNLINMCWTFSPQTRLTFDRIKKQLREINPSNTSAIDNMMHMMEKYSKHLEQLVNERTAELESEKERATTLLYRMIPEAVAEELKVGKTVEAEQFEGVTIFFSDIVGFTNLAGSSTPMQIVGLLNKLYTEFDQVLDQFDVYKVETIGDAYMVVSGVPRPNGDRHVGEIARMALKLVACCETFTVPHKPGTKLQIRAGIHSGSVCAGIVGVKMPRYCLFGDTVNTASRMESSSIAMNIQCSNTTYKLLEELGGFTLENRGVIEVKGKGSMNTWWLKGYTEPEIEVLPPPLEDTSLSLTTMEPVRDAPKKMSSVGGMAGGRSADMRSTSTTSLPRGMPVSQSSTALDVYKRHQTPHTTGSFSNLLSAEEGERGGRDKMVCPRRSITMPREATPTPASSSGGARHSVPHIIVSTLAASSRRLTQPNMETVGLGSAVVRESVERRVSCTSVTSRETTTQLSVAPLDGTQDTSL